MFRNLECGNVVSNRTKFWQTPGSGSSSPPADPEMKMGLLEYLGFIKESGKVNLV